MCGICGYVGLRDEGLLRQMTGALRHRGPDDEGFYYAPGVGLGHRRLSIVDLEGGHQPIPNEDGTVVVICNGEIYNHQALRERLQEQGHRFRTRSDTEVIVHLYEEYAEGLVDRLAGMFAFALYDAKQRKLLIVRDRLGIKPLFYADLPDRFLFSSSLKPLLFCEALEARIDPAAVHDYLALRYVRGPGTMIEGIRKLPAGHLAIINEAGEMELRRYWEPQIFTGPWNGSEADYLEGFRERFERSVERRLMSDVPVGAYLSGGVDSSLIVAAFARMSSAPVRTFTVGFGQADDEVVAAEQTAALLGCEHTSIECTVNDLDILPDVVHYLDEPIGDPIVIPMYLLAQAARRRVTVVLTGEGADEIFGGYLYHKVLLYGERLGRAIPRRLRAVLLRSVLQAVPARLMNLAFDYPADLGPRGKLKVVDFMDLLDREHLPDAYRHLISLFDRRDTADLYTDDFRQSLNGSSSPRDGAPVRGPILNRILHLQFGDWLPDDILTKQDNTSMAHAIEARVPFLDHELVEYGLQVPPKLKIRRGETKYLLRRYAEELLPSNVARRSKRAFYAPLESYLEDPRFRELIDDTLNGTVVRSRGMLRPEAVGRIRDSMHSGDFIYAKQAFSLVMLELWLRTAVDRAGVR